MPKYLKNLYIAYRITAPATTANNIPMTLLIFSFSLNTSSVSGGSSNSDLYVSGLPFSCGSGTGDRGATSTVRTQNWVSNARSPVGGYINQGTNYKKEYFKYNLILVRNIGFVLV